MMIEGDEIPVMKVAVVIRFDPPDGCQDKTWQKVLIRDPGFYLDPTEIADYYLGLKPHQILHAKNGMVRISYHPVLQTSQGVFCLTAFQPIDIGMT